FESNHGFIQWAFPTNEKSYHNFSAPALDLKTATWLANNDSFCEFLEEMTARFLQFLADNSHWRRRHDHNHLRISRAIKSIRLLHSWELANWFYEKVKDLAGPELELMEKPMSYWDEYASPIHDRIAGGFVGLAIGDALGAPVEFCRRNTFETVTGYREGGKFNLPAGAWTDDTAMAICLAKSLIEQNALDQTDLLNRFCRWAEHGENTSTGVCVGIGQNTLRVLGDYRRTGSLEAKPFGAKNDGNGSLMRLFPAIAAAYPNKDLALSISKQQSKVTHASTIAEDSCAYAADLIFELLSGINSADWCDPISSALEMELTGFSDVGIRTTGYVVDTLQASIWAALNSNSFEEAVLKAINLGDDADTVGAVTGQIAGSIYGYSKIPSHLKSGLVNERDLYVLSQFIGGVLR
ncbi:MAG: hypothetical protein EBT51_12020, partial [Flavobacteriaceae bacterium]|nr:hypothetical protein [Flavobacteriaceae bacterium]